MKNIVQSKKQELALLFLCTHRRWTQLVYCYEYNLICEERDVI